LKAHGDSVRPEPLTSSSSERLSVNQTSVPPAGPPDATSQAPHRHTGSEGYATVKVPKHQMMKTDITDTINIQPPRETDRNSLVQGTVMVAMMRGKTPGLLLLLLQ